MTTTRAEEVARKLGAVLKATELHATAHPTVQRSIHAFNTAVAAGLQTVPSISIGFARGAVIVNGIRLQNGEPSFEAVGPVLGNRQSEITLDRGVTLDELRRFIDELADRSSP